MTILSFMDISSLMPTLMQKEIYRLNLMNLWIINFTSTSSLFQVGPHTMVVREHRGRGSNLSSHVTNCSHSCAKQNSHYSHIEKHHLYQLRYRFYLILPVHDMESTPGPWYSTMAPVPPLTVRMPATFKMTSLGDVQPDKEPVSFTPITFEDGEMKTTTITTTKKENLFSNISVG